MGPAAWATLVTIFAMVGLSVEEVNHHYFNVIFDNPQPDYQGST